MSNVNDYEARTKFELGDTVTAFGVEGKVIETYYKSLYPIHVEFNNGKTECFTYEGHYKEWHKSPALIFIERERKATITLTQLRDMFVDIEAESGSYVRNRRALEKWMKTLFNLPGNK